MSKSFLSIESLIALFFSCVVCTACTALNPFSAMPRTSPSVDAQAKTISAQDRNIDPNAVKLALTAYEHASQRGLDRKQILTIIDFSKPSTARRLCVVDLRTDKVLYQELVAHGKNSGGNVATHFSDQAGSLESSIGLYETASEPYQGQHGLSLRLNGLDRGFNDRAAARAIVLHGAPYVSDDFARHYGRLGLSWGCPAVNPAVVRPLINEVKGGTLVFAYYPDRRYLQQSEFLRG